MDFVEGLSHSRGKLVIYVVVDWLSKYSHFIPIKYPYMASFVAQEFFENVFRLHGILESIVCDKDLVFTSSFWKNLFQLNEIKFNFSFAYHPQMDDQTKVVNRIMEMYLRCFTSNKPN